MLTHNSYWHLKDSIASIFRVKQCNMSRVLTPEDASTTILPNTSTYWPVNMASSTFLLFPYQLLMPWKLLNLVRVIFLNKCCSSNTYLLLLISFPVSLPNCIRVQDFQDTGSLSNIIWSKKKKWNNNIIWGCVVKSRIQTISVFTRVYYGKISYKSISTPNTQQVTPNLSLQVSW